MNESVGVLTPPLDLEVLGEIDWARLVCPQRDGYDTDVFARIAAQRWGWQPLLPAGPTWLDGAVEIRAPTPPPWGDKPYVVVAPEDPRWAEARELLATWGAQYAQVRRLVNYVGAAAPPLGLTCGCECSPPGGNPYTLATPVRGDYWGCVYATMHSVGGFCEGIVHELAHWKGYALGMFIVNWEHLLVTNEPPAQVWMDSAPTREEAVAMTPRERRLWLERGIGYQPFNQKMRPLGALFQELWCCVHMMALHLGTIPYLAQRGEPMAFMPPLASYRAWADWHVARTMRGHRDLMAIVQPTTPIGTAFWAAYDTWVLDMADQAKDLYEHAGAWVP